MFDEASPTIHQSQGAVREPLAEIEYIGVPEPAAMPARRAISFGPFRLLPTQQLLLKAGRRVHLGSRALEILVALVDRPGELVGKAELMARVWPDTVVEEGNLKVQVAGLRRALGDGRGGDRYLATIPGRGYRFVAPVILTEELSDTDAKNLRLRRSRMSRIELVRSLYQERRFPEEDLRQHCHPERGPSHT
jgi:DNA-binding winged helix-turn-helix (wHTH) protein